MAGWLAWCIAAVGLAVGEVFTPGLFFLGPVALAAVASAAAAAVGAAIWVQLVVFVAGSFASLGLLRPIARAHLRMPAAMRTGAAALEGARAVVLVRVDQNGGRVRIGGEVWSARAYMPDQVHRARRAGRGHEDRGRNRARLPIGGTVVALIVIAVVAVIVLFVLARTIRIVPQARAGVVERLGRYHRTLNPGLAIVVPFIDRLKPLIDLREQVVSFPPQPVITEDNLVVNIDTVIYFQVTDPKSATYEIANYIQAIEQLTVTTLRNVIGGMALESTLTSRDEINGQLRGVLDEATGKWGIRVNRVELKAIDPPASIKDSMEKQMRADREKRATILTGRGRRSSRRSSPPRARSRPRSSARKGSGRRRSSRPKARRRRSAPCSARSTTGNADPQLLAYQYLQALPQIAQGESNKVWIIPAEFQQALGRIGGVLGAGPQDESEKP